MNIDLFDGVLGELPHPYPIQVIHMVSHLKFHQPKLFSKTYHHITNEELEATGTVCDS